MMSATAVHPLSDYEIERGKPMPDRVHAAIQGQIIFLLKSKYRKQYFTNSELTLATKPKASTPDISIYPYEEVSIYDVAAKTTDPPIITIEIQSPSQFIEELRQKAIDLYFPMGVQSAWIIVPAMRAVQVFTPDAPFQVFTTGNVLDPITKIELAIDDIFEGVKY